MTGRSHIRILAVVAFVFASVTGFPQANPDSLFDAYENAPPGEKAGILIEAGNIVINTDIDSANRLFNEACRVAVTPEDKVKAHVNLGITYTYLGLYNKADSALKRASELLTFEDYDKETAILSNLGINYFYQGRYREAGEYFERYYELAKKAGVPEDISRAANNLGLAYMYAEENDQALKWLLISAEIDEKQGNIVSLSNAYNNIALLHNKLGDLANAKKYYKLALQLKLKGDDRKNIYSGYHNLGIVYKDLGQFDSALWYINKALLIAEEINYHRGKTGSYSSLASIYNELGIHDKAIEYSSKALELARQADNAEELASGLLNLGDSYRQAGDLEKAKPFIKEGLEKAKEIDNLEFTREGYLMLSKLYEAKGKYREAYDNYVKYKAASDSILNIATAKEVANLQTKYETEKKEKKLLAQEIALKEKEATQKMQVAIIAFLLLLVIVIYWWFNSRRKRLQAEARLNLNRERNRIAMDLHDHVGAEIALVSSRIDTRVYKTTSRTEQEELGAISDQVRKIGKILRDTVWSIREENITVSQLLERIEDFAAKCIKDNLSFLTETNAGEQKLSPHISLTLYRICQEGITNIIKYAGASEIMLSINKESGRLILVLSDNGKGFDPSGTHSGYGLRNMKQRAENLGGTFELTSQKGKGTVIRITVPVSRIP